MYWINPRKPVFKECASKLCLHSHPVPDISNSVTTLSGNLEKSSSANLIEWQEKWSFRY